MKRLLVIILCFALLLVSCTPKTTNQDAGVADNNSMELPTEIEFTGLDDPALLRFVEDDVYASIVKEFDSDTFFVENVSAVYISKEYLDELAYNSKENIYFGYNLSELEEQFQGTKFVFTPDDNGQTTVIEFEAYDDTYDKVIRNVAIGTGVILLCVTVSVVTGGLGAPAAVSVVFAASAKSATIFALSGGVFSGVTSGIVTGIQTKDFNQSLKTAALAGSEGFMWGAITGAIMGGASEAMALKGATLNGLTMNEAAVIQKESKYPLDVIKQIHSVEEYQLYYKDAGLVAKMIDGKMALVREIDLNYVSELAGKQVTNLERMKLGYAAIDPLTGESYQLHHIAQNADGTLAILTKLEHQSNYKLLNWADEGKDITDAAWNAQKTAFWKSMATSLA